MPRDLGDVLHYFLPELESDSEAGNETSARSVQRPASAEALLEEQHSACERPSADPPLHFASPLWGNEPNPDLPIIGVPIGDRDVVRAALTWNLAVETARIGRRAIVLAPELDRETPLWPESGVGPLGTEVLFCAAQNLEELSACARDVAKRASVSPTRRAGGLFVRVPSLWLTAGTHPEHSIDWWLLISSPNHRDLSEAYELARTIQQSGPSSKIGVTIHGVSNIAEARRAFEHLSRRCETGIGFDLVSYGLLVDDLHVYRAIVAQRPIGLAHPQAPATLALMDVARLIAEDATQRSAHEVADFNG